MCASRYRIAYFLSECGVPIITPMVREARNVINLSQAARLLGCSISTLRRRDNGGVFPTRRDPNGYSVYTQADLNELRALKATIKPGRPRKEKGPA